MSRRENFERRAKDIDRSIGKMVRERRTSLKVSQEKLAEIIDVSLQQLQKYESGANRIGASRLYAIAAALETPIGFFFGETLPDPDDLPPLANAEMTLADVLEDETSFAIVQDFATINDHHLRRELVDVLEAFLQKARRDAQRGKASRCGGEG